MWIFLARLAYGNINDSIDIVSFFEAQGPWELVEGEEKKMEE